MPPKEPTLAQAMQEIASLRAAVNDANRTITQMQKVGGFADSKALGQRSTRLEGRIEVLERDMTMHKDVTAHLVDFLSKHLEERHDVNLDTSNSPDVIFYRKIKRRLREWAEVCGLMGKRRDAIPTNAMAVPSASAGVFSRT